MIVPRRLTPVPITDVLDALEGGHHRAYGYGVSPESRLLAAAHLTLEHGELSGALHGVFNDNLGNHDATAAQRDDPTVAVFATVLETERRPDGSAYSAGHTRCAYDTPEAGAEGYWRCLRDGFPEAYAAMIAADADAFSEALKARHYYTQSLALYERGVDSLVATWRARAA
jgi:hypothetical protein